VDVASLIVDFTLKVAKGEVKAYLPAPSFPAVNNVSQKAPLPVYSN
jgi:hypothetical protein